MKKVCFAIIVSLLFPLIASAGNFHSDFNTSASSANGTSCTSKSCGVGYEGVRMKIVDKDGQQIAGTRVVNLQLNFKMIKGTETLEAKRWFENGQNYIAFNDGGCSKVDYEFGYNGCSINNADLGSKSHSDLMRSIIFQNEFIDNSYKLHSPGYAAAAAFTFGTDNLFEYWDENSWKAKYGDLDQKEYIFKNLLEPFFGFTQTSWDGMSKDVQMGTYLLIEPTMAAKVNWQVYWGTAYELAQLDNYYSETVDTGSHLRSLILHRMPCSYYIDGGSIDAAAVAGLGIKGINTNTKQYFGYLSYDNNIRSYYGNGTIKSVCDALAGKNAGWMHPDVVSDSSRPTGISILWLGQLAKEELSCEAIEKDYKSKTGKDLKTEAGHLHYAQTIYTFNGKNYTVNDYYNSCTCDVVDNAYYYSNEQAYNDCMQRYALFGTIDLGGYCNKYLINANLRNMSRAQIKNLFDNNIMDIYIRRYAGNFQRVSEWTYDRYATECLGDKTLPTDPTPKKGPDCTPKFTGINTGNPGSCYTGQISYKESGEWKDCIFNDNGYYTTQDGQHNVSDITKALTYYDNSIGDSSYCKVYCTEDLKTNFNADFPTVEAGKHFT